MNWLGSVLFTLILFLSVVPYAPVVLVARLFGTAAAYRAVMYWVKTIIGLARWLCGLRYQVEGSENIPSKPSVALIKHSSAYETLIQLLIFPRQSWVLKRELVLLPFFGWGLAALNPIAIDRRAGKSAVEQVVTQGLERLADGIWIMVFPEGTRMPPGETRRYGISGALLAQRAGCLIVPVAHNAGDYWPRRGLRKRPGTVRFVIGEPIDPAGRDPREVNAEVQAWIEKKVAALRSGDPVVSTTGRSSPVNPGSREPRR